MPNGRCYRHGGASLPPGPGHPRWKHGRHSAFLPAGLRDRYEAATSDPDLISVRDDVALVDVRIGQLLEAIGETGSTRLWKDARGKFDAYAAGETLALPELDKLLTLGLAASSTWDELRDTLDLRRKLSESETRRLKDLHQMISVERAIAMMAVLVNVVRTHVTDRAVLAVVADQFVRLTGQRNGAPPTP